MFLLAILGFLVGAVLAQRFKVMVLLPATLMVLIAAAATGAAQSYTAEWTILLAIAGSASMQVGYLFGLGLRYLMETPATERPQPLRARPHAPTTPLT